MEEIEKEKPVSELPCTYLDEMMDQRLKETDDAVDDDNCDTIETELKASSVTEEA